MNFMRLTTVVGITSMLIGASWCYLTIFLIFATVSDEWVADIPHFVSLIFSFTFVLMAIPGLLMIRSGYRLTQDVSKQNIKQPVKYLSFFGLWFLTTSILDYLPEEHEETLAMVSLLVAILLSIPAYVWLSKMLMKREGLMPVEGEFVGRRLFLVLAWVLWFCMMTQSDVFTEERADGDRITNAYWELGTFFGSIIVAVVFYQVTTRIFLKEISQSVAINSPNQVHR